MENDKAQIAEYVDEFTFYSVSCTGCSDTTPAVDDDAMAVNMAFDAGFRETVIEGVQGIYCVKCQNDKDNA